MAFRAKICCLASMACLFICPLDKRTRGCWLVARTGLGEISLSTRSALRALPLRVEAQWQLALGLAPKKREADIRTLQS